MSMERNEHKIKATHYLKQGKILEAGKIIFEELPQEARPKWAGEILRSVVKRTNITAPCIDNILNITADPKVWNKAYDAFTSIRKLVLNLDELSSPTLRQSLMKSQLLLAELVAKVTYNSTAPSDGFDEDCGWWIAVCLKDILDLLDDESFSVAMYSKLCECI